MSQTEKVQKDCSSIGGLKAAEIHLCLVLKEWKVKDWSIQLLRNPGMRYGFLSFEAEGIFGEFSCQRVRGDSRDTGPYLTPKWHDANYLF